MKPRWQLSTQFLLLVSIPVIFQIGAFSWLIDVQHRTEPRLKKLNEILTVKSDVSIMLTDLIRICIEADYGQEAFLLSPEFDELRTDATNRAKNAAANGAPVEMLKISQHLNDLIDKAKEQIDFSGMPAKPSDRPFFQLAHEVDPILERSIQMPPKTLVDMTHKSGVILDDLQKDEDQYENVLKYSMIIETLLIAMSLMFLRRNIRTRFAATIGNSYKLASRLKLNPPVGGDDEIAEIDRAFHSMAARLGEAESHAKIMGDHARAVICALNEKLSFVAASGASVQVFGYAPDELLHLKVAELLKVEDIPDPVAQFDRFRFQNEQLFESRCIRKDGSVIDTEWSVYWSSEEHQFFCTVHDTTAGKDAARQRRQLLHLVSNDLQTPLRAVESTLADLRGTEYKNLSTKGTALLTRATSATIQMVTLVKDLLDLEKLEAGQLSLNCAHQPLRPVIDKSIDVVSGIGASFEVAVKTDVDQSIEIFADGDRVTQVLVNLLTNAIKFSPPGSVVLITARMSAGETTIDVVDHGRGISAFMLDSVFDRFRQTRISDATKKGGSGLGLAICRALVELHRGRISVTSTEGQGTTFTVTFPNATSSEETS